MANKTTTDHEEIRRWAEERGARPSCVRGTGQGDDVGMIRLDFPGYSGADSLEEVSWDDWFKAFDENNLALIYQETTSGGQKSNFNKLIARETAKVRPRGDRSHRSSRRRGASSGRRRQARGRSRRSASTRARSARGKQRSSRGRSAGGSRKRSSGSRRSSASRSRSTTSRNRRGSQSRRRSSRTTESRNRRSSRSQGSRTRSRAGSRSQSRSSNRRQSNRRSSSRRSQIRRQGRRTIKLTIPKDVRIEAKSNKRGGKKAA